MVAVTAPQLHEVDHVTESQGWMSTKDDARLSILVGETFCVKAWEMFQSTVFNEMGVWEGLFWEINFALLARRQPIYRIDDDYALHRQSVRKYHSAKMLE